MTRHWGPLGWMTLHSISLNYPVNPSAEDKVILNQFIEGFAECITCNTCKQHFQGMLNSYKRTYPQWNSSRSELFLFVCRAHNTVNKRIDKPIIRSVKDCIETIKNNSKNVSLTQYRHAYMRYLIQNWSQYRDFEGMNNVNIARQLEKINNSYWNFRETDISTLDIPDGDVAEIIADNELVKRIGPGFAAIVTGQPISVGFKISGGRLKLGHR